MENQVEKKAIVQLDLEAFYPTTNELARIDIKDFLLQEWLLKESDFRLALENINWQAYKDKHTLIFCSNDAIIPQWAYMLIAHYLEQMDSIAYFKKDTFEEDVLISKIQNISLEPYQNKRILIKGCSKKNISPYPYILITQKLNRVAKSVAFGESCSSVPLFKNL
jgi:hypothetical protein